jgi:hypothetical protein
MVPGQKALRQLYLEYPNLFALFSDSEGELAVRLRPPNGRIAEQLLNAQEEEARLRTEEVEARWRALKKEEKEREKNEKRMEKRAKQEAMLRDDEEVRMRTQQN